ncbi:MAG: hypothetical protein AABX16_05075 [Nanoarchaeota archaeon]
MTIEDKIKIDQHKVLNNIHVGDFVELFLDGKFFLDDPTRDECYGGYVTSLNRFGIELSATHPDNRFHGYKNGEGDNHQKTIFIELSHLKEYCIYRKN